MMNVILMKLLLFASFIVAQQYGNIEKTLMDKIIGHQVKKSSKYWPEHAYPPLKWSKEKGIFDSQVHVNFYGNLAMDKLRKSYHFPDSNGFVSMFVVESVIQAAESFTNICSLEVAAILEEAVIAISGHKDHNTNETNSSIMTFWNQKYDANMGSWKSWPENIMIPFSSVSSGTGNIMTLLRKIGFPRNSTEKVKAAVQTSIQILLDVFNIPGDADDTGCNLALGILLHETKCLHFKRISSAWGLNLEANLLKPFVDFSYKPFEDDLIDPRTYYWLHDFLSWRKSQNQTNISLIQTWLSHNHKQMPFGVNNIDASVVSNALYGISKVLIYSNIKKVDNDLKVLFESSIDLLSWIIENNRVAYRPDLLLLYYPSSLNFYMMTGRLVHVLNSDSSIPMLKRAQNRLGTVMRNFGTTQLLNLSKNDSEYIFWEDGILNSMDDSVFATAAAVNALIDIWTLENYTYDPSTPLFVKTAIRKAIGWLDRNGFQYANENVFFSGSMKSFPFGFGPLYPANYFEKLSDGEIVERDLVCNNSTVKDARNYRIAVKGYYDNFWNHTKILKCFGQIVPTNFPGYDKCDGCFFPYWSAPVVTRSFWLLAKAKAREL